MLLSGGEVCSVGSKALEPVFVVCLQEQLGCSEVRDREGGQMKTEKLSFYKFFYIQTDMQPLFSQPF